MGEGIENILNWMGIVASVVMLVGIIVALAYVGYADATRKEPWRPTIHKIEVDGATCYYYVSQSTFSLSCITKDSKDANK